MPRHRPVSFMQNPPPNFLSPPSLRDTSPYHKERHGERCDTSPVIRRDMGAFVPPPYFGSLMQKNRQSGYPTHGSLVQRELSAQLTEGLSVRRRLSRPRRLFPAAEAREKTKNNSFHQTGRRRGFCPEKVVFFRRICYTVKETRANPFAEVSPQGNALCKTGAFGAMRRGSTAKNGKRTSRRVRARG